jgi:cytochrome c
MKTLLVVFSLCLSLCVCLAVAAAADGKDLFARCQGCHGADGSKTPMGVGKPLKGINEADAYKALSGYKAMNYGGERKTIMEAQVKSLSDDDMKALAKYISTL